MVTHSGSLVQLCCGEGGTLKTNITGMCGEYFQCLDHTGFAPADVPYLCFLSLHCSGSWLLCGELSKAGPGFCALPRSKLLRFRYWGIPQRHRLGWACVLCPFWVQAAQVTRCLASTVPATYRLPRPCCLLFWVYNWCTFSDVLYVSSGELISGCDPPGGCCSSRIPISLG